LDEARVDGGHRACGSRRWRFAGVCGRGGFGALGASRRRARSAARSLGGARAFRSSPDAAPARYAAGVSSKASLLAASPGCLVSYITLADFAAHASSIRTGRNRENVNFKEYAIPAPPRTSRRPSEQSPC
jgi:hypothetical protein